MIMLSFNNWVVLCILIAGHLFSTGCSDQARVLYVRTPDVRGDLVVEFVIDEFLNNEQIAPTVEKLREVMGTNMCSIVKMNTPKRTFISIAPIHDVDSFIKRLDFARVEIIESRKYKIILSN
jgi:hypothetical protein